jgi:hypothetical protein
MVECENFVATKGAWFSAGAQSSEFWPEALGAHPPRGRQRLFLLKIAVTDDYGCCGSLLKVPDRYSTDGPRREIIPATSNANWSVTIG